MKKYIIELIMLGVFIPYRFFRESTSVPSITVLELVTSLIVIANIINIFIGIKKSKLKIKSIIIYLIFMIYICISYMCNIENFSKLYTDNIRCLIIGVIIYQVLDENINSKFIINKIIKYFMLMGSINTFLTIIQSFTGKFYLYKIESATLKLNVQGNIIENLPVGLFYHTNVNSYIILITIIVIFFSNLKNRYKYLLLFINIFALWKTQVKSTILLAVLLLCIMYIIKFIRNRTIFRMIMSTLPILILTYNLLIYYISLSTQNIFTSLIEFGTMKDRALLAISGIKLLYENPKVLIMGHGSKLVTEYTSMYARFSYQTVHCSWLDMIIIFGIIGILIAVFILKKYSDNIKTYINIKQKTVVYKNNVCLISINLFVYTVFISGMIFEPLIMDQVFQAILVIFMVITKKIRYFIESENKYENTICNSK